MCTCSKFLKKLFFFVEFLHRFNFTKVKNFFDQISKTPNKKNALTFKIYIFLYNFKIIK